MALFLLLAVIALISLPASAWEVAYAYGESGGRALESGNITLYDGSDIVTFAANAGSNDPSASHVMSRSMEWIKIEINRKVDRGNDDVRNLGLTLIGNKTGSRKIDQFCAIYDSLVDTRNWTYVDDWKDREQFQYSNYTLRKGQEVGGLGKGDCDDFAILLAALIESVGGTPRIVFAYSPNGGHAYTEVLLGKYSREDSDVGCMLRWLRTKYNVEEVNTHKDITTGEVWLNLDWWKDPDGAKHPGGPFFSAERQVQVYPENGASKTYLNPVNMPPKADFTISLPYPNEGEVVVFNASPCRDECGHIESYRWEFGDGSRSTGQIASHSYQKGGTFRANLTIRDDEDTYDDFSQAIEVNWLPVPDIRYNPMVPAVGDNITFDATFSRDEDGHITEYYWEFEGKANSSSRRQVHQYNQKGIYSITLTVVDDKGAQNATLRQIRINERPNPNTSVTLVYPKDPSYWLERGDELLLQGNCNEAITAYNNSYALDPRRAKALFGEGRAFYAKGEYDEALHLLTAAIELNPQYRLSNSDYADMWIYRANALKKLGLNSEADAAFDQAETLDPSKHPDLGGIAAFCV